MYLTSNLSLSIMPWVIALIQLGPMESLIQNLHVPHHFLVGPMHQLAEASAFATSLTGNT